MDFQSTASIRNGTEVSITEIAVGGGDAAFPQAGSKLGVRFIDNIIGRSYGALVALGEEGGGDSGRGDRPT